MKKFVCAGLMVLALADGVFAETTVTARTLSIQEMAATGATVAFDVKYSDFSTSTTGTAEVLTFDIAAGQGFRVVYAKTITEFVGAAGTDSLTLTVGNTDVDQYLTSMQLATESTEVSGKFGMVVSDGEFYEAADTIDFTFTPNAENATADFTAGHVRVYAVWIR